MHVWINKFYFRKLQNQQTCKNAYTKTADNIIIPMQSIVQSTIIALTLLVKNTFSIFKCIPCQNVTYFSKRPFLTNVTIRVSEKQSSTSGAGCIKTHAVKVNHIPIAKVTNQNCVQNRVSYIHYLTTKRVLKGS